MPNKNSIESEIRGWLTSIYELGRMWTAPDNYSTMPKNTIERGTQELLATHQREVKKGRVDELKHIMDNDMEAVHLNFDTEINPLTIKERIAELEKLDRLEELEG
jgi:hypothetical protein